AALYGWPWIDQYLSCALDGWLFFEACNLVAVAAAVVCVLLFGGRRAFWLPVGLGYGALFAMHASIDLAADAQAAVALVFIPVFAVPMFAAGVAAVWLYGLFRRLRTGAVPANESGAGGGEPRAQQLPRLEQPGGGGAEQQ
ncbi:MAG TPA: hypothetical protein PKM88_06695, partial [bacterium]|nr:hypothetical protein [bacterium]